MKQRRAGFVDTSICWNCLSDDDHLVPSGGWPACPVSKGRNAEVNALQAFMSRLNGVGRHPATFAKQFLRRGARRRGGGTKTPVKSDAPSAGGANGPTGQTGSPDKSAPGTPVALSAGSPKAGTTDPAKPAK